MVHSTHEGDYLLSVKLEKLCVLPSRIPATLLGLESRDPCDRFLPLRARLAASKARLDARRSSIRVNRHRYGLYRTGVSRIA